MTTNTYQFETTKLAKEGLYNSVLYRRTILALGTRPAGWSPKLYENANKDILKVTMGDVGKAPSELQDNVFQTAGISYQNEVVKIRPIIVEVPESAHRESNVSDVQVQTVTELSYELDKLAWKALLGVAAVRPAYTFVSPSQFIGWALGVASELGGSDIEKTMIIPESIMIAIESEVSETNRESWMSALEQRMARVNTIVVSSKVATQVVFVQKPFLAEYSGVEPSYLGSGIDERKHERWTQFSMSNSDFKARRGDAAVAYPIVTARSSVRVVNLDTASKKSAEAEFKKELKSGLEEKLRAEIEAELRAEIEAKEAHSGQNPVV
ncbi:MAG: hypothetical protein ACRCVN_05945 [Spirochaetia bacterium]